MNNQFVEHNITASISSNESYKSAKVILWMVEKKWYTSHKRVIIMSYKLLLFPMCIYVYIYIYMIILLWNEP